jgi:hypothetical protein
MTVKFGPMSGPLTYSTMTVARDVSGPARFVLTLDQLGKRSEFVDDAFRKSAKDGRVLQFKGESDSVFRLAFLSWAFLALFAKFGYTYALAACSQPVRTALITRSTRTLGEVFFEQFGEFTPPLSVPEACVMMGQLSANDEGMPNLTLVGLGALFANQAAVAVPIASDPDAARLKNLTNQVDVVEGTKPRLAPAPFDELFPWTSGVSFLATTCAFQIDEPEGRSDLVRVARQEAVEVLSTARAPVVSRHRPGTPSAGPNTTGWQERLPSLPRTSMDDLEWLTWIESDLIARLAEGGATQHQASDRIHRLCAEPSADGLRSKAATLLPRYLAQHLEDSYRLLVLGHPPKSVDYLPTQEVHHRMRALLRTAGMEGEAAASMVTRGITRGSPMSLHAAAVTYHGRQLILGPFYSGRTILLAAQMVLPEWRDRETTAIPS